MGFILWLVGTNWELKQEVIQLIQQILQQRGIKTQFLDEKSVGSLLNLPEASTTSIRRCLSWGSQLLSAEGIAVIVSAADLYQELQAEASSLKLIEVQLGPLENRAETDRVIISFNGYATPIEISAQIITTLEDQNLLNQREINLSGYTQEESKEIEDRLKALGYL